MQNIPKPMAEELLNHAEICSTVLLNPTWNSLPDPVTPKSLLDIPTAGFFILRDMRIIDMISKEEFMYIFHIICREIIYKLSTLCVLHAKQLSTDDITKLSEFDLNKYRHTTETIKKIIHHIDVCSDILQRAQNGENEPNLYYSIIRCMHNIDREIFLKGNYSIYRSTLDRVMAEMYVLL